MTTEFSLPIRVYIEDTDAGGIVYYVNYLKYLERSRTELMRTFGLEGAAISDTGWMFVVSDLSLTVVCSHRAKKEPSTRHVTCASWPAHERTAESGPVLARLR